MSATELAALMLAAVALVATAALAIVCGRLVRVTRSLQATLEEVHQSVPTATARLADAADRAARQVDRLEDLIHTTASITEKVDTATQATFRVLSNPVIKGAALASGTGRAARRLRGRGEEDGKRSI